jgi:hypothetical protein
MDKIVKRRKIKRHWYFTSTTACVLCGHEDTYRERRYGRPPAKHKRYEYKETACSSHF